ncbi:MAG: 16S/23S rRNA (cytidine-2'-O)-methyltransferase [Actinobacteria bacterium HGW-Actinobacteria-4]|nr:MAG: 16S/23S rRNA (cytidine-2'-O)-methyltransferase [Actinobacteria bacterium HGW-Actinobacteria-4]
MRLDRAVLARGLARSRTHAQSLIAAGAIAVDGMPMTRAALPVGEDAEITVVGAPDAYVSRAAHKLLGALDACEPLGLTVHGRTALDAGASTGGFTQVLLERGVSSVIALDVGHSQLDPRLRGDSRVTVVEGTNVRDLTRASAGSGVDLVVADLSFISLTLVVAPLVAFARDGADLVLMVKPQFEVGRERLRKTGVVTDRSQRAAAVHAVVSSMRDVGLAIHAVVRSPLPGPNGNVEFFVWGSSAWQARTQVAPSDVPPMLDDEQVAAAIAHQVEGLE